MVCVGVCVRVCVCGCVCGVCGVCVCGGRMVGTLPGRGGAAWEGEGYTLIVCFIARNSDVLAGGVGAV